MKTSERDIFVHQSLHRLLCSFMFLNPMALAHDHAKIIDILTLIPLRIIIPFPSSPNSSTKSEVRNTSPKWIFGGVITIFESKWKAAFTTNRGSFEPTIMFFRLTNSPASFQTMKNAILKDLIDQGHIVVYMDNILVFTKDLEEHRLIGNEVLKRLKENDLFLKPQKCFFEQKEVKFLG